MSGTNLRFCMLHGHFSKDKSNYGRMKRIAKMHPAQAMEELGIKYTHSTPQTMGDQWWFWNCSNVPDELPLFLSEIDLDPFSLIGKGLSRDQAEDIYKHKGK